MAESTAQRLKRLDITIHEPFIYENNFIPFVLLNRHVAMAG